MTFHATPCKSNAQVTFNSHNIYAHHRSRELPGALREGVGPVPPEFLLQAVWQQQRLLRDRFETVDGRPVRVLHPGFKNHEAGPDFREAVVQIGNAPPLIGDIEIDLNISGWRAHGHENNPNFKNVILHVIWEGDHSACEGMPTLALKNVLDAPLDELVKWIGQQELRSLPYNLLGKCCAPLRELSQERLTALLHQAAEVRWRSKAAQLQARAKQAGWEQALWEGIFRALGYKQNIWPMQNLAEMRQHWCDQPGDALACQARLFGLSGLLPTELARHEAVDIYVRKIWDHWWRERAEFEEHIQTHAAWRFNALRPANHPQRRLALAAHWLAAGDLFKRLEHWFTSAISKEMLADSLLAVLQVKHDDFWSWHWTFQSTRFAKSQPLLGAARVTDLAVNVILPWFWIRAVDGKNDTLRKVAEERYLQWPSAEDNSKLRLARQRLLANAKPKVCAGAAAQQGLLQIVKDFCEHSNALCDNCAFPGLVREFTMA